MIAEITSKRRHGLLLVAMFLVAAGFIVFFIVSRSPTATAPSLTNVVVSDPFASLKPVPPPDLSWLTESGLGLQNTERKGRYDLDIERAERINLYRMQQFQWEILGEIQSQLQSVPSAIRP
jgi:hypothetical protein